MGSSTSTAILQSAPSQVRQDPELRNKTSAYIVELSRPTLDEEDHLFTAKASEESFGRDWNHDPDDWT